ncbi:fungal-specific transcription factor domain-domain-containing protein [Protomyces lactucae-debilis]|uniref:Fungal-specific transcription factor domain-domain-containing protein n=1 Tax=Protomyces lactucae-debilis TaxID=2754530 RepID=A0A1Y2FT31_PROLT|nr:fungal-specific transcription factor domain-containing protein [Protomyces lactucae-debilis]ORY87161.1 fungal-specific transcription factor domain-domain-containing protein [Protomyces lactucae-debilis]
MDSSVRTAARQPSITSLPAAEKAERKRTLVACNRCRRRRQKCDGGTPSCSACVKSNSRCVIEDPHSNRAYPRGYVSALEARVAQLEEALYSFRPDLAQDHLAIRPQILDGEQIDLNITDVPDFVNLVDSGRLPDSVLDAEAHSSGHAGLSTRADHDERDSLADSVGLLALSASDRARGDHLYIGASSGYAFARVFASTFNAELPNLRRSSLPLSGPYADLRERVRFDDIEPAPIPTPLLAERLTRAYFAHMSWQYPILCNLTFSGYVSSVLQNPTAAPDVELFFVNMVWAIGARLSEAAFGYSERYAAKAFYKSALQHCESVFELDDVRAVQALFLMAIYALQNHAGTSLWRLVGLAMNVAMEQGLHRDVEVKMLKQGKSPADIELRSRIFWSIYALDRSDALFLGRPHRISDDDIDVKLPRDVVHLGHDGSLVDAEVTTGLTMVIHLFKIRRIQSCIQKFCCGLIQQDAASRIREKQALRAQLESWIRTRPHLSEGHHLLGSPMEYHDLLYHNSLFILHRTALHQPELREGNTDIIICCDAASRIIGYFILMQRRNELQFTFYTMHHCFGAGVTLLFCIWSVPPTSLEVLTDLATRIRNCSSLLTAIAQIFPQARPFRDTFESLATAILSQVSMKMPSRTPLDHLDANDPFGLVASMPAVMGGDTDVIYVDMINEIMGETGHFPPFDPGSNYDFDTFGQEHQRHIF